jgi:nitrogen fixation-related uncharacterized protein
MWFGGMLIAFFWAGFMRFVMDGAWYMLPLILPLGILGGAIFYWTRPKKKKEETESHSHSPF